jgi:hypothetical protein
MGQGSPDENRDLKKEIEALIIHLLCFKHKMKNVVWTKGTSGLEGKFQSGSEASVECLLYSILLPAPESHVNENSAALGRFLHPSCFFMRCYR